MPARHRGQTKTGISTHTRLCIREVARELEEDMELGAEGDLNAAAPSTTSFPPPCSLSLAMVTVVLSFAVVTAPVACLYSTPATALCSTALCWVPQATRATV